ncbi:uncharacterized protein LOC110829938 isoform X2 [Zootermopsis nevadensis]|nr:uncharacterized protein LOC110829938 isoform X2 [Zootermopsis nevadensis]
MEYKTSVFRGLPLKIKTEALDNSENVLKPTVNVTTDIGKAKLEKLSSLRAEVDKACSNYFQHRLLLSAVKEVACESDSEFPLITQKVQQIIASQKVANIADLNFGKSDHLHESLMVLGLEDSHKCGSRTVLSYTEKINLKSVVEDKLLRNCSRIQNCIWKGGKELPQKVKIHKNVVTSDRFELVRSTSSQFKQSHENLVAVISLINELLDMRLTFSETVRTEAVPWFEAKCESLELEAKILELQILVHMLSENQDMPEAMKRIDDYSQKLYEEMKSELEKLMDDEKTYDKLTGTEYDNVVKKYKQCKQELNYKTWVLNELS